jgi:LysM repeat protein
LLPNILLNAYVVQSGDTVTSIATKYGITSDFLMQMNNLTASSVLMAGQSVAVPPAQGVFPYIVNPQYYLYSIATQYGITNLNSFASINDLELSSPSFLPGQILLLPLPSNVTGYLVQSGDSFSSIATTFKITLAQLQTWNPWVSASTLQPGDILIVGMTS